MLRKGVKLLLFLSAYSPLFLILIILNFNQLGEFWTIISIGLLLVINLIWPYLFNETKKWNKNIITIKKATNRTHETLTYLVPYLLAFSGKVTGPGEIIASTILLVIIYFVYIHSDLIFVNPLLAPFGYKIYDVETKEGGNLIVISKDKTKLRGNQQIKMKNIAENVYLKVK